MNVFNTSIATALAVAGMALTASGATAQEYPDQEIQWIIPFSPGSGADTFSRTLIGATEDVLDVTIVPVNREGGGTAIGVAAAASSAADGYTLFSQSDTLALGLSTGDWPVTVDDIQAVARINADYKTLDTKLTKQRAEVEKMRENEKKITAENIRYDLFYSW